MSVQNSNLSCLFEDMYSFARDNYSKGWARFYESMTENQFSEEVAEHDLETIEAVVEYFNDAAEDCFSDWSEDNQGEGAAKFEIDFDYEYEE